MAFKNAVFKILAVVEKLVQVTFQCTEVTLSQRLELFPLQTETKRVEKDFIQIQELTWKLE